MYYVERFGAPFASALLRQSDARGRCVSQRAFACQVHVEPVGVLRLRWFADFAKVERAAVLQQYRRDGVMRVLMQEALRYSARRGYRRVIGHAQLNRVKYWRTHGFRVRPDRPEFYFSDYAYVEIERELIPPANAITADTDPMVLIRPDGEWDRPGPFDLSLERLEAEKEQARKDKKKSKEEAA